VIFDVSCRQLAVCFITGKSSSYLLKKIEAFRFNFGALFSGCIWLIRVQKKSLGHAEMVIFISGGKDFFRKTNESGSRKLPVRLQVTFQHFDSLIELVPYFFFRNGRRKLVHRHPLAVHPA
jgi:hypothetical protein